ncbi:MAG: hypothetical protein M3340_14265 [Actinomycetota bacterium]|nr:hypothetical protein [Actinomycetota bacterium]
MLFVALLAAPASASTGQESIFQDDRQLLESGPDVRNQTLDELKALGVDTIRVNAIWARIAPERDSESKPGFDATDPGAYPSDNWSALDSLLQGAAQRGIGVYVTVTGPAPKWASPCGDRRTCDPNRDEFKSFVTAIGKRYSGSYVIGGSSGSSGMLPLPKTGTPADGPLDQVNGVQAAQAGTTLPRVGRWSVWNEPNLGSWLTPQYTGSSRKPVPASARIYRGLLYAALDGLAASGHGDDQVLVGETAPIGRTGGALATRSRGPLAFWRDLLCIDTRGRATSSSKLGCKGSYRALPSAVAHHPYTRAALGSPTARAGRDDVPLASIRNLYRVLDQGAARKRIGKKAPVFLTEYGVQTKPPDRFGVSLGTQARWINQADWMAYRDGRIRSVSQYELVDPPEEDQFNTGLRRSNGDAKPSLAAYRLPIWVSTKRVWGQVRAASGGEAELQWRSSSKRSFKKYRTVKLNSRGYFNVAVNRRGGQWRLVSGDNASRTASGYR